MVNFYPQRRGSKKSDKTILSEGKGRRQNAKTLVAYVKHKLGLSEKFDYDAFVKRTRLLGDLLYAHKIEHFCLGKKPNEVDFDPQKRKKVAWVSEGKPTTTIEEAQNVAPSLVPQRALSPSPVKLITPEKHRQ